MNNLHLCSKASCECYVDFDLLSQLCKDNIHREIQPCDGDDACFLHGL